jgi:hypothetical protein
MEIDLNYLKTEKQEAMKRQRELVETVGLDFENLFHLSK